MTVETRTETIRTRLDDFVFSKLKTCKAATPTREQWDTHPAGPYKRFGFRAPVIIDGPTVIVSYCPELIAAQTEHLDPTELDEYLTGIEFIVGRMTQYVLVGDDAETATTKTENELYDRAPECMKFMNDVWSRTV